METALGRLRREFADPLSKLEVGGACDVGIGEDIYFFYVQQKIPYPLRGLA